jgi:hypothetical protein
VDSETVAPSTPPAQRTHAHGLVDEDSTQRAAFLAEPETGRDGVHFTADDDVIDAAAAAPPEASAAKKKASKRSQLPPKTEKSVHVRDFFEQLTTPKRLAVFLHALRLWRQLADDAIEALVYFLTHFRSDDVRASPAFYSVFAILPFADIMHNRTEAPVELYTIAMEYLRDFWCVSTGFELRMRCVFSLFLLDPSIHVRTWLDSRDPVVRELCDRYGQAMSPAAAAEAPQGYTMYDEDGNAIETNFDHGDTQDDGTRKKRRAKRTRRVRDEPPGADGQDEMMNEADDVIALAEQLYREERQLEARGGGEGAKPVKGGSKKKSTKKKHRKEGARDSDDDGAEDGSTQQQPAASYLDENGDVKPKDQMTKAERKAYKKDKKRRKKEAKRAKKELRRAEKRRLLAEQGDVDATQYTMTQGTDGAGGESSDDADDGSSSSDGDEGQAPGEVSLIETQDLLAADALSTLPTAEQAGLASFVASPPAIMGSVPSAVQITNAIFDDE